MLVADALSHYAPLKAPEIPLDITINNVHITPDRCGNLYYGPYHGHWNILTVVDGLIL